MDRRTFIGGITFGLLLTPPKARAQSARKIHHIGLLAAGLSTAPTPITETFRQRLRELGWVEGQNIIIDYRFAEYRYDRLPDLAAELVQLGVDIIVAPATPAAVAAKNATGTIPIVMVGVGDPVASGLIDSLAHPGGNVTGLTFSGGGMDIFAKQLELLIEAVPGVRSVAILSNPTNPANLLLMKQIKGAGRSLGVELQFVEARGSADLDGAFAAVASKRAGAVLVFADSVFLIYRTKIADLAAKNHLPLLGYKELVDAGAFMSYGPSLPDLGRRAAVYVDRILKGAKPADLPVEQPVKLDLVINLRTAKKLGLTIPQSLLVRADEVIQ